MFGNFAYTWFVTANLCLVLERFLLTFRPLAHEHVRVRGWTVVAGLLALHVSVSSGKNNRENILQVFLSILITVALRKSKQQFFFRLSVRSFPGELIQLLAVGVWGLEETASFLVGFSF